MTAKTPAKNANTLLHDLRGLIEETRSTVATTVNAALTTLYWRVGKRINEDILKGERAAYGTEILQTVSAKLMSEYGGSFSEKNLRRMIQFAGVFSDEQILVSLIRHLSWAHFIALIPLKDSLKRESMPRCAGWNAGACGRCAGR